MCKEIVQFHFVFVVHSQNEEKKTNKKGIDVGHDNILILLKARNALVLWLAGDISEQLETFFWSDMQSREPSSRSFPR